MDKITELRALLARLEVRRGCLELVDKQYEDSASSCYLNALHALQVATINALPALLDLAEAARLQLHYHPDDTIDAVRDALAKLSAADQGKQSPLPEE